MGAEHGRRAIVGAAVGAAAEAFVEQREAAQGDQLTMLPIPIGTPAAKHLRRSAERQNLAGRPPGATNKSNALLREYLLARGVHPLHRMMSYMLHTPQSLAAELNCSLLEAYRELRILWTEAAPYFAHKLAPVDGEGKPVPFFQMVMGAQQAGQAPGEAVEPWINPETGRAWGAVIEGEKTQQNQAVPFEAPAVSQTAVSHDEDK